MDWRPSSGKCNEDVFRIPDVASDPLKVEVLKADLSPLMSTSGKTLTVLNWSIYYNKQVQKKGSMLDGVGIQGYTVPAEKKKKSPEANAQRRSPREAGTRAVKPRPPISRSFRNSRVPSAASRSTCAWCIRRHANSRENSRAPAKIQTALLEAVHKTSEALATAIGQ